MRQDTHSSTSSLLQVFELSMFSLVQETCVCSPLRLGLLFPHHLSFYSLTATALETPVQRALPLDIFLHSQLWVSRQYALFCHPNMYFCGLLLAHPTIKIELIEGITSILYLYHLRQFTAYGRHWINICGMNFKLASGISPAHYMQTKGTEHQIHFISSTDDI